MARMKNLNAKAETHPQYKVPCRIYDIESEATGQTPREAAESVLKQIADELHITNDLSQLKFDREKPSILGTHVLFQQYHNNRPITGAWVRVDVDKHGKVYNIQNDLIPLQFLSKGDDAVQAKRARKAAAARTRRAAEPEELTADEAIERAFEATGDKRENTRRAETPEYVYFPHDGIPMPAWKVTVESTSGRAGEWKVYVDAVSGDVLESIDLIKRQNGHGQVFDPNPVVTLNDTTLEDDAQIPAPAYFEISLPDLEDSGHLDGPFVSTRRTNNRVKQTNFQFVFERADRAFKEVMVYYHIDRVQRYIQSLGFDNVLNQTIEVDVDGIPEDNSFYSPLNKALTFGRGGVDDAEDADIILHEYGHAIQDHILPGFGTSRESRAMGEGFGDYLAGSFFASVKAERLQPCVGTWDAVSYSGDDPPNLRRLDSNKKYPRDMVNEEHADGEIWSACLWEIHAALGGPTADRLIIAHHFQLPNNRASFEDAAKALITTDEVLNDGRHTDEIRDVFVRRGILPNRKRRNKRAGVTFDAVRAHAMKRACAKARRGK